MSRSDRHPAGGRSHVLLLVALAGALTLGAFVMSGLSLSASYDSSCASLREAMDRRMVWELGSSCGLGWFATAGLTVIVLFTAVQVLAVAWLVHRGTASIRVASWLLVLVAAAAVVCLVAVTLLTTTFSSPVLRRGWVGVRNLTAAVAAGLSFAAFLLRRAAVGGSASVADNDHPTSE